MSAFGNIPIEVREILARVKYLRVDHNMSWEYVKRRLGGDPEREAKSTAADKLAHDFAGQVLQAGAWRVTEEPEGPIVSVSAACFTYERLAALVMEAYAAGQKDGMRRAPALPLGFEYQGAMS